VSKTRTVKSLRGVRVVLSMLALGALVVVLAGCGRQESAADPLAGTKWVVRSYYNPAEVGGMASPVGGTELTAEFFDGQVAGSAGCNSYTASYTVDGDSLSIGQAAATMMFCEQPTGAMDQEAAFLSAMQSASSFKLEEEQLHILNDKGQVVVDLIPSNKLVVGTSADYPPFESYVTPGQLDGFDIALMDEIGRRLGMQIEYRDIAFDGLGPALLQGQIDAAIAAISKTPEREAYADFSNVYLVGEGAAVAQQAADITLTKLEDVAKYKVGVQRNSVYKNRIQTLFIDTGKMSPDNLFAYEKAEDAVNDLLAGRIELVVMDLQAAQAFTDKGGIKIVGIGDTRQNYAIALPKRAVALKAKINQAITDMFSDGTLASLSERYLGASISLPTPTPGPTTAPVATPTCVDNMALVKQLTTEGDMKPGQAFTKGWQVKNTGTCPWTTGYKLVFVSGDKMGGEPVAAARQVNTGETYDWQVPLVAPQNAGSYEGVWQMVNAQGAGFGEKLKVNIRVVAAPTATPKPNPTAAPGIEFTVDRDHIKAGESVVFSWKVTNVKEYYFYSQFEAWQDHPKQGDTGSEQEYPQAPSTTYYLRVVYPDGSLHIPEITVYVEAAPAAPQITQFTVDPAGQITLGQCVTIRWKVEGDKIDKVTLSANGEVLWEPAPTTGNTQHCPTALGTVTYVLEATGPGGTTSAQQQVEVIPEEKPVPPPEDPVIYVFDVSPNQITVGNCVNVTYSAGGGTASLRIMRDGGPYWDPPTLEGTFCDVLNEAREYTYQLVARGQAKDVTSDVKTVSAAEAAPVNPLAGTRWQVTAYGAPGLPGTNPVLAGTTLTMDFSPEGSLNGSSGCNTYSSTYLVNGSQLNMTLPVGTGMICGEPAGIMEQEAAFLGLIPVVDGFSIEGTKLLLQSSSGQVLVELVAY